MFCSETLCVQTRIHKYLPMDIIQMSVPLLQVPDHGITTHIAEGTGHLVDALAIEFSFIPKLLVGGLLSHYGSEAVFRQQFCQDWIIGWKDGHDSLTVWSQAGMALEICNDDEFIQGMVLDITKKLDPLVLANSPASTQSDDDRRSALIAVGSGLRIGEGLTHGSNACLIDSLIQVLAAKRILPMFL